MTTAYRLYSTGNEYKLTWPVPEKYHIVVKFDKSDYAAREKVRATIAVTDAQTKYTASHPTKKWAFG
jgi:hypothetical protein